MELFDLSHNLFHSPPCALLASLEPLVEPELTTTFLLDVILAPIKASPLLLVDGTQLIIYTSPALSEIFDVFVELLLKIQHHYLNL